jgi:hypothetical protein
MNNKTFLLGCIGAGVVGYFLGTGYYNQFIKPNPQPKPIPPITPNPQPKPIVDTLPGPLANPKGLIEGGLLCSNDMCGSQQA